MISTVCLLRKVNNALAKQQPGRVYSTGL